MSDNENYFILLVKKQGKKRDRSYMPSFKSGSSKVELLAGTLLVLIETLNKGDKYSFLLETLEQNEAVEVQCIPGEIENIALWILDLLSPVPTCQDRLAVYQDRNWLKEAHDLQTDDYVLVKPKGEQIELPGILRYKGRVPSIKGIIFGVELTENPGSGTSDGIFRKQRFFTCRPDSAVFCPVQRIRKQPQDFSRFARYTENNSYGATPHIASQDYPDCGLQMGERVVWMSDSGPEFGTVKWLGVLPEDRNNEITVGVEFDKAVGSGTGKYKEHRLFYAEQNHASLVPILGLIKLKDFISTTNLYDDSYGQVVNLASAGDPPGTKLQQGTTRNASEDISLTKQNYPDMYNEGLKGAKPKAKTLKMMASDYNTDIMKTNNLDFSPSKDQKFQKFTVDGEAGMNPLYDLEYSQKKNAGDIQTMDAKYLKTDDSTNRSSQTFSKSNIPAADPDLGVDSMVEVLSKEPLYGVIRWIGRLIDDPYKLIAGLEMEKETPAGTDGTFKGERFFHCAPKRAFFVPLYKCQKDKRFHPSMRKSTENPSFGLLETPDIPGDISPLSSMDVKPSLFGKNKGIQGHHNSCYLDATLFSMFSFTTVFDSMLYRPRGQNDLDAYDDVQKVMKEGIVNPLRKNFYVRADKVMKLRVLLDKLGEIPGMMGDEKDPEEFLSSLLGQIMKAEPLLHLSSGEKTNFYQLFMEKDEQLLLPTTQKLVELSFHQSNVKLKEVPSCLIIQMPRFGKDYKMFRRIVPSLELDITDILEEGARECIICGKLATFECKNCYQLHGPMLSATAFCETCCRTSHLHKSRKGHEPKQISVSPQLVDHIKANPDCDMSVHREKMELFAVVCIQTSHYVSFVKCGTGKNAPWVFFDSMADRMGEQKGYNIPEVKPVPELCEWLSENKWEKIFKMDDDKLLPEDIRRLLCDAYMCMYQNPEVAMFK